MVERTEIMIQETKMRMDSPCYMIQNDLGFLWLAVCLAR